MTPVVQVLPLGPVPGADLAVIAAAVDRHFSLCAEGLPPIVPPTHAFDVARGQHDADRLLDFLFDKLEPTVLRLVGVTDLDLFADGRNFVFGYAHMRDRVAVFSTRRMNDPDPERRRMRLEKALIHELGHTFHSPHCEAPRCVMRQVEFLWQLDDLPLAYCGDCAGRVATGRARAPGSPESLFELAASNMRRRRFARAAALYGEACGRAPGHASYHNDHGVALLAVGDRPAAVVAFTRAVELAPASPHAWYNLGIVSRERGDLPAADHFFGEALRRDPDPRAASRYLGVLHQDYFRDAPRARRFLEHYRALGGSEPDVLRRLETLAPAALIWQRAVVSESSAPA